MGEAEADRVIPAVAAVVVPQRLRIMFLLFSSSDAASVAEGATTVITVEASDEDSDDTLTFSLSGDDAALFALSDTNVLSFLAAPDYEAPGDVGADNVYNVVITVSDGTDDATQSLGITVTDVASPAFTSASTLAYSRAEPAPLLSQVEGQSR